MALCDFCTSGFIHIRVEGSGLGLVGLVGWWDGMVGGMGWWDGMDGVGWWDGGIAFA